MKILPQMWESIQGCQFPYLEEECGTLTEKQKQEVKVLEVVRVEEYVEHPQKRRGRKRKSRAKGARAFVVKAVYNLSSTRALIDLLQSVTAVPWKGRRSRSRNRCRRNPLRRSGNGDVHAKAGKRPQRNRPGWSVNPV